MDITASPAFHTSTLTLIAPPHQLWDCVGVDGLQVVQVLFGAIASKIAPFQSFEAAVDGYSCSVLRLCEGNFRIAAPAPALFGDLLRQQAAGRRVWVKPCQNMSAIALADAAGQAILPRLATTKPLYRLDSLPLNCAAPARIDAIAVLIWRHVLQQQPVYELHLASRDIDALRTTLQSKSRAPY